MSEEYALTLTKEGKLIHREWVYDHEIKKGEYTYTNRSDNMLSLLDKQCCIEPGFKLRHLCELLCKDTEIYDMIFINCFILPYIKEYKRILATVYVEPDAEYNPENVEFLELYWNPELYGEYIDGTTDPCFHGKGWVLREDKFEEFSSDEPMWKAGERINWAIDFSAMEDLLHLPIMLDESFNILQDMAKWEPGEKPQILLSTKKKYRLADIIFGVFWEISFHGVPEDAAEKRADLDASMEDIDAAIKSGDMSMFHPINDLLKDLDND